MTVTDTRPVDDPSATAAPPTDNGSPGNSCSADSSSSASGSCSASADAASQLVQTVCSSAHKTIDDSARFAVFKLLGDNAVLGSNTPMTTWPARTDVWCWYCCHPFEGVPLCVPHTKKRGRYSVYGVFCSLNCAIAHVQQTASFKQQQVLLMLRNMAIDVFGFSTTAAFGAAAAPNKAFLRVFGGHLSIDDFRATSLTCCSTVLTPPFVSLPMVLETSRNKLQHHIRGLWRPQKPVSAELKKTSAPNGATGANKSGDAPEATGANEATANEATANTEAAGANKATALSTPGASLSGGGTALYDMYRKEREEKGDGDAFGEARRESEPLAVSKKAGRTRRRAQPGADREVVPHPTVSALRGRVTRPKKRVVKIVSTPFMQRK